MSERVLGVEQLSISVVTGICQLSCVYCPAHSIRRRKGFLDPLLLRQIVDDARPRIVNLQGYGEPTLHPRFADLLTIAKSPTRIVKFFSNLNGWSSELIQLVVRAGIDQVIVSVDAFTDLRYSTIRKDGDLAVIRSTLESLIALKRRIHTPFPEIIFNVVVMRDTLSEIQGAIDFASAIGDGQPIYELLNDYGDERIANLAENRIDLLRNAFVVARKAAAAKGWRRTVQNLDFNLAYLAEDADQHGTCRRPWRVLTVLENGDVVPCGEFHEGQVVFGNLAKSSVDKVWSGPAAWEFRRSLADSRSCVDVCNRCMVNEASAHEDMYSDRYNENVP